MEMPRIMREIELYEERLSAGKLTTNTIPGSQFNEETPRKN